MYEKQDELNMHDEDSENSQRSQYVLNDRGFDGNCLCEQQSSRATVLYQTYSHLGSKVMQGKVELVFKRIEVRGYCYFTESSISHITSTSLESGDHCRLAFVGNLGILMT